MQIQFKSMSEFLAMSSNGTEYGFYVWLAYGITFFSIGTLIFFSARQKKKVLAEIAKKIQREERLKENRGNKQ